MVNSFIAKKDLDSEMTVVRNEFERGENSPTRRAVRARDVDGVSLAQLRQVDDRLARATSRTCRSTGCRRSTGCTTSPTTPSLLVAGKFDEAQTLDLVNAVLRRHPEAGARPCRSFYTAEPTQDGERSVTVRRVGDVQCADRPATTCPPARIPTTPPSASWCRSSATRRRAGCTRRWSRRRKPASTFGGDFQLHDPGIALLRRRRSGRTSSLDAARDGMLQAIDDDR